MSSSDLYEDGYKIGFEVFVWDVEEDASVEVGENSWVRSGEFVGKMRVNSEAIEMDDSEVFELLSCALTAPSRTNFINEFMAIHNSHTGMLDEVVDGEAVVHDLQFEEPGSGDILARMSVEYLEDVIARMDGDDTVIGLDGDEIVQRLRENDTFISLY